jgi:glutamyl-Q tRNA(Asp) synthetase
MTTTPERPVFRFAPSPNGEMHLGHAFSALFTAEAARAAGGRFILRMEDIDLGRARPEFEQGIHDDLSWLGLTWEEPVRRQSEHFGDYRAALVRLRELGLVYPCFATRAEIEAASRIDSPRDPEGMPLYPGLWRWRPPRDVEARLSEGAPFALRLDMARAVAKTEEIAGGPLSFIEEGTGPAGETGEVRVEAQRWGDVVIARKEVPTSYHLAVVVDDALQGVTHVTRGQDLFYATFVHRVLQTLLGLPVPRYRHHALIRDESGRKLAKSARDTSLKSLREAGVSPEEVRQRLGFDGANH